MLWSSLKSKMMVASLATPTVGLGERVERVRDKHLRTSKAPGASGWALPCFFNSFFFF